MKCAVAVIGGPMLRAAFFQSNAPVASNLQNMDLIFSVIKYSMEFTLKLKDIHYSPKWRSDDLQLIAVCGRSYASITLDIFAL